MAKEVNLLSYWMPILRNLKEFKEISKAEEPELKYLLEAIDRALGNMFIETADEYGISRFEKMLGINPSDEDNLELRRLNVQINWNNKVYYTYKELCNRLSILCGGEDNFSIVKHFEEYWLEITTNLGVKGSFDVVSEFLAEILPCNLVLNLKNVLTESSAVTSIRTVGVTTTAMRYFITNDIKEKVSTTDGFKVASPVSTASVITLN